ncbi:MAG: VanZ family protein [Porticoccaceae bacterium]
MLPSWQYPLRAGFGVALTLATWIALRPITAEEWFSGQDKLLHMAAYVSFYLWGGVSFPDARWRLPAALLAYGVAIEWLQSLTPYRTMSLADVVANALGLVLGAALLRVARQRWPAWSLVEQRSERRCR